MLERDTTFILGAGASFDFNFPLGDGLRNRIMETLQTEIEPNSFKFVNEDIHNTLMHHAQSEVKGRWTSQMLAYRRAADIIREGLPFARSIDIFLDGLKHREELAFVAKLAIAYVILRCEESSSLTPHGGVAGRLSDQQKLKSTLETWHVLLSQILYDGHTIETIDAVFSNAAFVVFNYDRCLEEFLTVSLMRRFDIDRERAIEIVRQCDIVHPYGQVGDFFPGDQMELPFGQLTRAPLLEVAARIKTFTESMETGVVDRTKNFVARSEVLVFLGFGWLPQNMDLLGIDRRVANARQVFSTVMNIHRGEVPVIQDQINLVLRRDRYAPVHHVDPVNTRAPSYVMVDGSCKALMQQCWLRLTQR